MRKIYTFLLVAFVITIFNSNTSAQAVSAVDTVKYEFCKIRSNSADQNTSGDAAGKIKVTQDGVARIDMDYLNDLTHSVIDSAFIRISVGAVVPCWFDFYEMDADWLFSEITWTSAEDYNLATTPFGSVYFDVSETTYLVDITEYLKAKITDNTDFAYRLIARPGSSGSAYAHFTANTDPLRQPSIIIYTSEPATGVSVTKVDDDIIIYPNPLENGQTLHIESGSSISDISIYDLSGKLIIRKTDLNTLKGTIDLPFVKQGIYFLQFETDNNIVVKKIIIN